MKALNEYFPEEILGFETNSIQRIIDTVELTLQDLEWYVECGFEPIRESFKIGSELYRWSNKIPLDKAHIVSSEDDEQEFICGYINERRYGVTT